jgi:hypothetical protein
MQEVRLFKDLQAALARHGHVQEHQGRALRLQQAQGGRPVAAVQDAADRLQDGAQELPLWAYLLVPAVLTGLAAAFNPPPRLYFEVAGSDPWTFWEIAFMAGGALSSVAILFRRLWFR